MRCLSCSKEISASAEICPYCHHATEDSVLAHAAIKLSGVIGVIAGMLLMGGFWGGLKGGFAGLICVGLPLYFWVLATRQKKLKQAATVASAAAVATPTSIAPTLDDALATLERLKERQLISEDEYQAKRQELLRQIGL